MASCILVCAGGILTGLAGCGQRDSGTTDQEKTIESEQDRVESVNEKYIVFFGNSLTAGYQLTEEQAFPALIQHRLDSLELDYTVVNAGLSGETSAGGASRVDWVMQQPVDIFVLELGANDALRGLDLDATRQNLGVILDRVLAENPDVTLIIAGMKAPPNMGPEYTEDFNAIFPDLASEYEAALIPFLLENVAANPELNLDDGIHPNVEGQKVVMENVWTVLKEYL